MARELAEAVALGALHGPAELVPISSSAHVAAVPWLLNWDVASWGAAEFKELEVALHCGTALALIWSTRAGAGFLPAGRLSREHTAQLRRRAVVVALALAPPVAAGLRWESTIEQELRGPRMLSAGLLAGAAAIVAGDRMPQQRVAVSAGWRDGLALGVAQACALVPGLSRSGMALAAARARGFDRSSASILSWQAGLPVLVGASSLKGWRLLAAGRWRRRGPALAAAGLSSALSTLLAVRWIGVERRAPLWPWALWRAGLAAAIVAVGQNRQR